MREIGLLVGLAGLCVIPVLIRRLLKSKDVLAAILSIIVTIMVSLCAYIYNSDLFIGVAFVYIGVVLINLVSSGYRHTPRKGGGADRRYSANNNPFYEGLFSGSMMRACIALVITLVFRCIKTGEWGPLGLLAGFAGGFFIGIYHAILKPLFGQ